MVPSASFLWVNSFSFPFKHLAINPHCVWYFAAAEVGGKVFASSTLLLTSTFLQNVWYLKLLSVPLPLYIAMMASSPALMISCFLTTLGNLFNTSIALVKLLSETIFFNATPFPDVKILDVVSHPKIACSTSIFLHMPMPNFS